MAATNIPSSHRGLVLESVQKDLSGVSIQILPTPKIDMGSAIVQVLGAGVLSYQRDIYDGMRDYPLPTPLVGGYSAIGRVVAVGSDAIALKPGDSVYVDCVIRGRDDPDSWILSANSDGVTEGSRKLMRDVWRNGTFAEFVKAPLENCVSLDETRLCHDLGYSIGELVYMSYLLVPYGGLRDIRVEPGETVVVCPATGGFGGAAVQAAIAMGARVIAMGRNEAELARIKTQATQGTPSARVETVRITGDENRDTAALRAFGVIDAVVDLSPPAAGKSPHLNSAISALRRKGRVSLMGGFMDGPVPSFQIISKDVTIKGKLMYGREDILQLVKMMERGLFPKAGKFADVKTYSLDDWKDALDQAAGYTGMGRFVVLKP